MVFNTYVILQNYVSHLSFIFIFSNPTHKTKIGTTNRWKNINNKPLRPIIMIGKLIKNKEQQSLYLFCSYLRGVMLYCAFYQP
jgi:hypothetical protein